MTFVVTEIGYDSRGHFNRYRCENCNEEFEQRCEQPSPLEGHNCMDWDDVEDEELPEATEE